jgi:hypothetical protein
MRVAVLAAASAQMLTACGGGDNVEANTEVARSLGSRPCSGRGQTLEQGQSQRVNAGIAVSAARCGHEGVNRPAVCGAADGRHGAFTLPASRRAAALALGFETWPVTSSARKTGC